MELEDNSTPIVDDLQGISGQQLRPRSIQSLNIIIIIIIKQTTSCTKAETEAPSFLTQKPIKHN